MYEMLSAASALSYGSLEGFVQTALLPYGLPALFVLSFFNSSVSPIPTEFLLVPLVLLQPEDAFTFGTVATVASVLGAWFGYYLGARGAFVKRFFQDRHIELARRILMEHGIMIVGVSGISPLPFKLFCITSGVFRLDLRKVLAVSLVFRGFRFYGVALLLSRYRGFFVTVIQDHFAVSLTVVAAVVVLFYLASRRVLQIEPR